MTIHKSDIESAERRLSKAESHINNATRTLPKDSIENPSSVLVESQRTIEHAAKTIFILMSVNEPSKHVIPLDSGEAEQLLNAVDAELDKEHTEQTARLLFLANLYGNTYPVSEYGLKLAQSRIEADDFLDRMEGDQAYNHAVEAIELVRDLVDVVRERNGLPPQMRQSVFEMGHK